jgi:hypothetical protein
MPTRDTNATNQFRLGGAGNTAIAFNNTIRLGGVENITTGGSIIIDCNDTISLGGVENITTGGSIMLGGAVNSAIAFKDRIDNTTYPSIVITDGAALTVSGIGNADTLKPSVVKVGENSTLTIDNVLSPLRFEISTGGVVNNLHVTDVSSTVVLGENSVATITGQNMNFDQVVLGSESQFDFIRDGVLFHINPGPVAADLVVQDIHLLADLCGFLNQHDFSVAGFHLPLEHTHALRLYSENKELVEMMFVQNQGVTKPMGLDIYIKDNLFETYAISRDVEFPVDALGEITSYLDFSDMALV